MRGKVRYIAAGSYHACAILDDYSVECWGNNDAGQIGAAPEVLESAEPVKVMLPK